MSRLPTLFLLFQRIAPRNVVRRILQRVPLAPFLACAACFSPLLAEEPIPADALEFFESRIRPALIQHCYECHSSDSESVDGGLLLDSREGVAKGGDGGLIVNLKDPKNSRLIEALRYASDDLQMPPDGKLDEATIAAFEKWIELGTPDPRTGAPTTVAEAIEARARNHWAFQPVERPEVPELAEGSSARTDIDKLIFQRLAAQGIKPNATAAPATLVRRLYFDLVGIPPTYEQVQSFVENPTDAGYAALVDELIASPHFGEKWARHWLDLSRYGDTKGYVFKENREYPNAYRYRDWVINAFNDDMPYDEFLTYQLAADQLPDAKEKNHLSAHGYITLGRRFINNRHDIVDDRIDVVFRGMMGLTVSCARCHDHKYDPVSTKDYYGLTGVFWSSKDQQDDDLTLRLVDKKRPHNERVLIRGNTGNRGEEAPRRFPTFFAAASHAAEIPAERSGRLELAQAITDPGNPLTARVFVNRVWSHLFGRAIVETTSDFGLRCDQPIHQDVLDCLAADFRNDWSVKSLIRQLVMSESYRLASHSDAASAAKDPENLLLWRRERRRLGFEAMRDSLLAVSGKLDSSVGGESVRIDTMPPATKRTLYAYIDRQNLPNLFRNFDFASPDAHAARRLETTVPQQALYFLNSLFVQSMAEHSAARTSSTIDSDARVTQLYRTILARQPSDEELSMGTEFVAQQSTELAAPFNPWSYGYGGLNDDTKQVQFTTLGKYVSKTKQWQGEGKLPGKKLGWVFLNAEGGHPGGTQQLAAIRRWTAPATMRVNLRGSLRHIAEQGDGVRGRIISSRQGALGEWYAHHQSVQTRIENITVEQGERLDFIVDPRSEESHDTFAWHAALRKISPADGSPRSWSSRRDFHGPLPAAMTVWQRYAQALMLTNEFMFLD